jgi:O-antigen ligase
MSFPLAFLQQKIGAMTARTSSVKSFLMQFFLVALFAFIAGSATIALFLTKKAIVLSIIGGILIVLALGFSRNQRLICLWGIIFSAPLDFAKDFKVIAHMGGAGSFSIELVDLFLAPMLIFILRDLVKGFRNKIRFSWVTFYWGGLILLGVITVITGPLRTVAAHEVFRMIKCLILFLIIINELVRVKQFEHVFLALMLGVFAQAVLGICQYVFDLDLGMQLLGETTKARVQFTSEATFIGGEPVYRVGGLLGHPNFLAAFMALLLPIGISIVFTRIKVGHRIFCYISLILGIIVLVLTLSRAGWAAFVVGLIFLNLLFILHPRMKSRYLLSRIVLIGIIFFFIIAFSGKIIQRLYYSDPGALNFRYELIEVAWKMIKEKPIRGFGLNTFVYKMPKYTKYGGPIGVTERFGEEWPVVHNSYLIYWVEQGTIGLILFLGLHICIMKIGFNNMRFCKDNFLSAMNIGCMSGILAIMVDGMASFFVRSPPTGRVFWIVAAIIIAINYRNRSNRLSSSSHLEPSIEQLEPNLAPRLSGQE